MRRLSLALAALGLAAALPLGHASGRADARGTLTLLAFLDLAEVPFAGRGSRSQAVFLRSMAAQHPQLCLLLVDVSAQDARRLRSRAADWHLDDLRVVPLAALDGDTRARFSGRAPETLLLRGPGTVVRRWAGFVSAAQLGAARGLRAPPGSRRRLTRGPALPRACDTLLGSPGAPSSTDHSTGNQDRREVGCRVPGSNGSR